MENYRTVGEHCEGKGSENTVLLSLAYAAMAQPLHRRIRCCVEGSETTFELVYRAAVNDVRHGLGGSTDAQWAVGITPQPTVRQYRRFICYCYFFRVQELIKKIESYDTVSKTDPPFSVLAPFACRTEATVYTKNLLGIYRLVTRR